MHHQGIKAVGFLGCKPTILQNHGFKSHPLQFFLFEMLIVSNIEESKQNQAGFLNQPGMAFSLLASRIKL